METKVGHSQTVKVLIQLLRQACNGVALIVEHETDNVETRIPIWKSVTAGLVNEYA